MRSVYALLFGLFFYALTFVSWVKTGNEIQIGSFIVCANVWLAASLIIAAWEDHAIRRARDAREGE